MSTIVSVQRSSEYRRTFSATSGSLRKSSEIFGSGSDVFGNPGHARQKSHAFDSEKVGRYTLVLPILAFLLHVDFDCYDRAPPRPFLKGLLVVHANDNVPMFLSVASARTLGAVNHGQGT